jgi:hypothetical protein
VSRSLRVYEKGGLTLLSCLRANGDHERDGHKCERRTYLYLVVMHIHVYHVHGVKTYIVYYIVDFNNMFTSHP